MTDPNRGAYTPQSDAPLSFDARRAGGGRGPMPITLIFSALILLVLVIGGGVAVLYHNGARKAGEPPQPVGVAVGTMKAAAPEVQNAPQVAVAQPAPPAGGAPTFTAPPEQPAARPIEAAPLPPPAPAAKPAQEVPPPAAPTLQAKAEPAPKALSVTAPAKIVPEAKPSAPAAKTAAATTAAKPAAPAPAKAAAGGVLVQIGAYSSSALASNGWNDVAKMMPGEMAGKTKEVEPVERDGKTLYRARIGGFGNRADAERLCLALLSKGHDCKVV